MYPKIKFIPYDLIQKEKSPNLSLAKRTLILKNTNHLHFTMIHLATMMK